MKKIWLDSSGSIAFTRTPEGYLRGTANVVKCGVFDYVLNGKSIKVLRHPNEVFKKESLETLKMIPLTFKHPYKTDPNVVLLNSKTTKKFSVGFSGEEVEPNGEFITVPLCVYDTDSIGYVDSGINNLSAGYTAALTMTPGVYDGTNYDGFQSDFTYNHIAIEEHGRSGDEVAIVVMDDAEFEAIINNNQSKEPQKMKKILINGVEMEVADEIASGIETERAASTAKLSTVQAVCDAKDAELTQLKTVDVNAIVEKRVTERLETIKKVKVCLDCDDAAVLELPIEEQKKKAIAKRFPTIVLDGKDEVYINALLDAAVSTATVDATNTELNKQKQTFQDSKDPTKPSPREAYIARLEGKTK